MDQQGWRERQENGIVYSNDMSRDSIKYFYKKVDIFNDCSIEIPQICAIIRKSTNGCTLFLQSNYNNATWKENTMGRLANEVGRFLRKLRIDKGEILYDMAQKMGCSSAFISALELGKRQVTRDFRDRLCEIYALSPEQCDEFDDAISLSKDKVEIGLQGLNQNSREMLLAFARKMQTLNDEEASKLLEFLTKKMENDNGK